MIFLIWIICAALVAVAAKERGRSFGSFLFLSLVFSPLITGLFLALLPVQPKQRPEPKPTGEIQYY